MARPSGGWGLVATVKAPQDQVMAFVAHHLAIGARHIWIYLDDPDDPAFDTLSRIAEVTVTRCDTAHWARIGTRPDRHQNRQSRNAQEAYRAASKGAGKAKGAGKIGWLGHIDVDEFIFCDQPLLDHLDSLSEDQVMMRLEPFEAMHDPDLRPDIFTGQYFRGALTRDLPELRETILGPYHQLIPDGLLSHRQGKALSRTGINGLQPRLHGPFLKGFRLPGPQFQPGVALLHFHAQDRARWQAALPFRLTRGAYQYHPAMQDHLSAASPDEVATFYATTQMLTPDKRAALRAAGRLVEADLDLAARVRALEARLAAG